MLAARSKMKFVLLLVFCLHASGVFASGQHEYEKDLHSVLNRLLHKLDDLEDTVNEQQEIISKLLKQQSVKDGEFSTLRARKFRALQEVDPVDVATTEDPVDVNPTEDPVDVTPPSPEFATQQQLDELRNFVRRRYTTRRSFNDFKNEVEICLPKCSRVYAVDSFKGDFSIIDINTNEIVETIGQLHPDPDRFTEPKGMAKRPNGDLVIWNKAPESDVGLSLVDKSTGLATLIGTPQTNFVGGIAYFRGLLYGGGHRAVLSINDTTGETVVICRLENSISGMTAIPSDDKYLYAIATAGHRLIEIDPPTSSERSDEPCKVNIIEMTGAREIGSVGTLVWNRYTNKFLGSAWNERDGIANDDEFLFDLSTDGAVSNIRAFSNPDVVPGGMEFVNY